MYNPFRKPVACIAIEKYKIDNARGRSEITNKSKHNFRLDDTMPMNPEKTKDNVILVDAVKYPYRTIDGNCIYDNSDNLCTGYNFVRDITEKFESNNINPRKGAVAAVGIIMKVTEGWERLPSTFDLDKWIKDSISWLKETWGKDNIISAVLHSDEFTPHIHAIITPITEDGRLCFSSWVKCGTDLSQMQKSYYKSVKQDGIQPCQCGQKMPFSAPESQRKAQNALYLAGEVDIVPERAPGENDKEYQKRVTNEVQLFSMQKHLQLVEEYRRMQAENTRITLEKEAAEERAKENEKERKYYRDLYIKEKEKSNFYEDQLAGSGISRSELKNTAELKTRMEREFNTERDMFRITRNKISDKCQRLTDENSELKNIIGELKEKNYQLRDTVKKQELNEQDKKNSTTMEYILYGLENGCPGAEHIKECMLKAFRFATDLKRRERDNEMEL